MTTPLQPEVDPHDYLVWLYANGTPEQVQEWEQHLWNTGQNKIIDVARNNFKRHDEFNRGLLGGRMARTNQNEREMVEATRPNYPAQVAGGISGLIADVPGGEALQAGARSLVRDQTYPEALGDIRSARESNPASIATRIAGSLPAAMAMPGGAFRQGATYGGLLNFLSADPDEDLGDRTLRGLGGAAIGGVASKAGDLAGTFARTRFLNPGYEKLSRDLSQRADEAVAPLYDRADEEFLMAQGRRGTQGVGTPGIRRALNEPDIGQVADEVSAMREFRGLPQDDPRVLDRVYKGLVDAGDAAEAPLQAVAPRGINMPRLRAEEIGNAKRQFLDAVSRAPDAPAPTYALAVEERAAQGGLQDLLDRGAEAAYRGAGGGNAPSTLQRLAKRGPLSLLDALEQEGPEGIEMAVRGVESAIKQPTMNAMPTEMLGAFRGPSRASLWSGGDLMRQMQPTVANTSTLGGPTNVRGLLELLRLGGATAPVPEFGRP